MKRALQVWLRLAAVVILVMMTSNHASAAPSSAAKYEGWWIVSKSDEPNSPRSAPGIAWRLFSDGYIAMSSGKVIQSGRWSGAAPDDTDWRVSIYGVGSGIMIVGGDTLSLKMSVGQHLSAGGPTVIKDLGTIVFRRASKHEAAVLDLQIPSAELLRGWWVVSDGDGFNGDDPRDQRDNSIHWNDAGWRFSDVGYVAVPSDNDVHGDSWVVHRDGRWSWRLVCEVKDPCTRWDATIRDDVLSIARFKTVNGADVPSGSLSFRRASADEARDFEQRARAGRAK